MFQYLFLLSYFISEFFFQVDFVPILSCQLMDDGQSGQDGQNVPGHVIPAPSVAQDDVGNQGMEDNPVLGTWNK